MQVFFDQFITVIVVVFGYVLANATDGGDEVHAPSGVVVAVAVVDAECTRGSSAAGGVRAVFSHDIIRPVVGHGYGFGGAAAQVEVVVAIDGGRTSVGVVVDHIVQPAIGAVQDFGFTFAHLAPILRESSQIDLGITIVAIVPGFAQHLTEAKGCIGVSGEVVYKTRFDGAAVSASGTKKAL